MLTVMGYSTAPAEQSTILVAVDLSERLEPCLARGWKMAVESGRPLVAAHIVHESVENAGMYRRHQKNLDTTPIHDIARSMLEERVAAFRASGSRVHTEFEIQLAVVDGIPETRIIELAARCEAGTIVMCSRNRRGLSRWFHGSITESVLRRAECPVVIVGQGIEVVSPHTRRHLETQPTATLHSV